MFRDTLSRQKYIIMDASVVFANKTLFNLVTIGSLEAGDKISSKQEYLCVNRAAAAQGLTRLIYGDTRLAGYEAIKDQVMAAGAVAQFYLEMLELASGGGSAEGVKAAKVGNAKDYYDQAVVVISQDTKRHENCQTCRGCPRHNILPVEDDALDGAPQKKELYTHRLCVIRAALVVAAEGISNLMKTYISDRCIQKKLAELVDFIDNMKNEIDAAVGLKI